MTNSSSSSRVPCGSSTSSPTARSGSSTATRPGITSASWPCSVRRRARPRSSPATPGPRAGPWRRGSEVDPARASGRGDGDARRACRTDQPPVTDRSDPSAAARSALPTGTVTFLRTDVEGSMGLTRTLGSDWDRLNEEHLGSIAAAVARHGGVVVRTEGDALFAAFGEAGAGASAATDAQRALHDRDWPAPGGLRVRMGLHSGEAHRAGDDYGGFEVNRAARIAATGHGGQIVVSGTTAALIADQLPGRHPARGPG